MATSGQLYWSDDHQLATYLDDYHTALDRVLQPAQPGTEMITELSVPRALFEPFLAALAGELRARRADLIYGTVRLIERDDETFLPWARVDQACVVLNLHVPHTPAGTADAATTFRGLIDVALRFGGTYYLTYHRHATAEQVLAAHPRFLDFLREKRLRDPDEHFASDWYRHYRQLFVGQLRAVDPVVDGDLTGVGAGQRGDVVTCHAFDGCQGSGPSHTDSLAVEGSLSTHCRGSGVSPPVPAVRSVQQTQHTP